MGPAPYCIRWTGTFQHNSNGQILAVPNLCHNAVSIRMADGSDLCSSAAFVLQLLDSHMGLRVGRFISTRRAVGSTTGTTTVLIDSWRIARGVDNVANFTGEAFVGPVELTIRQTTLNSKLHHGHIIIFKF